jgi:hypothetical protein
MRLLKASMRIIGKIKKNNLRVLQKTLEAELFQEMVMLLIDL